MAIESIAINAHAVPSNAPAVNKSATSADNVPVPARPAAQALPQRPKVEINQQPLVSTEELTAKIASLNAALVSRNQAVAFSTDTVTGRDIVKVTNRTTGELIRQIPAQEALTALQNMDRMMGLIFDHKT